MFSLCFQSLLHFLLWFSLLADEGLIEYVSKILFFIYFICKNFYFALHKKINIFF